MQADETVLSEVHMETCPPAAPGTTWSTRFLFSFPSTIDQPLHALPTVLASPDRASGSTDSSKDGPTLDSDGDLVLDSRPRRKHHSITIHHSLATTISRCGEQVWQGSCLLGDWVLVNRQQLQGQVVIELGAGVGLVSLLAGMFAKTVFLTDADAGALQLAQRNTAEAAATAASLAHRTQTAAGQDSCVQAADIRVRALDWFQLFDTQLQQLSQAEVLQLLNSTFNCVHSGPCAASAAGGKAQQQRLRQQQPQQEDVHNVAQRQQQQQQQGPQQEQEPQGVAAAWQWSPPDLQLLAQTTLWLAADVVYDQTLTDAFMHTAAALMRWQQQQQQHTPQSLHCQCTRHQPSASATDAGAPAAPPTAAAAVAACGTSATPQLHPQLQPRLIVALEKRYNFTLRDMDAVAPAFDHFMSYIQPSEASLAAVPAHEQQRLRQQQQQQQHECLFQGQRIDVHSVPQVRIT